MKPSIKRHIIKIFRRGDMELKYGFKEWLSIVTIQNTKRKASNLH